MRRPLCWLAAAFFLLLCVVTALRDWEASRTALPYKEVILTGRVLEKTEKKSFTEYNTKIEETKKYLQTEDTNNKPATGSWEIILDKVLLEASGSENGTGGEENKRPKEKVVLREENSQRTLEGKYILRMSLREPPLLGQRIRVRAFVAEWEEVSNPGQFDLGRWYHSRSIMGEFRRGELLGKTQEYSYFKEMLWQLRKRSGSLLSEVMGEKQGALLSAMVLGDKGGLLKETKELYQRNGISHILAISGLHLMLLGMGVFRVTKLLFPWSNVAEVLSSLLMIVYCIFSGASISTIRATIMFVMTLLAKTMGRVYDSLTALAVAALLQLLNNPYGLENSGFLLSFFAVIGVTLVAPGLETLFEVKGRPWSSLFISFCASLTTLPILLDNYGVFNSYSILLNLLILPPMALLLGGGVLLILISHIIFFGADLKILILFQYLLSSLLKAILWFYEWCCNLFEQLPFRDGYLGSPSLLQIIVYYSLLFLLILSVTNSLQSAKEGKKPGLWELPLFWKRLFLFLLVGFLTVRFPSGCEITMLDVGQGDGMVIKNSNGNVYLCDFGSSSVSQVGEYRLLPFLKEKGYSVIQGIFLSHLDEDHYNGVLEILRVMKKERLRVKSLIISQKAGMGEEEGKLKELLLLAEENKLPVIRMKPGQQLLDGRLEILCLSPKASSNSENANGDSMVLHLSYNHFTMLLTGDVEGKGEEWVTDILRKRQEEGEMGKGGYDVLKVAHHGSKNSTKREFLQLVNPKISLVSYEKNNSYGHPHRETMERLEEGGGLILETAKSGAITIKIGRKSFRVEEFKNKN